MANNSEKKGMLIDVQPLKSKQEVNDLIEALDTFTVSMADHMAREEQYYLTKVAQSTTSTGSK